MPVSGRPPELNPPGDSGSGDSATRTEPTRMGVTLLTGATGTLGSALRPRLSAAGHEVRAASRSPPDDGGTAEWVEVDLATGAGLDAALDDVDVVVHAATAPRGDTEAVDVDGTRRLLTAATEEAVENVVYPSIVGIDDIPYSYYEHKLTAERLVADSDVPSTVLRATQFHSFVHDLLGGVARLPVWPLPTRFESQPVDVGEVADAVAEYATVEAAGRVPDVGGPEVESVGELAKTYREVLGVRRPVLRLPLPGSTAAAFRAGHATCPDRAVGTVTWEEWLRKHRAGAG